VVWGDGAQLPGELPLGATWGSLREAYGDAVGSTESGETRVRFGSQPQFLFTLDADPDVVGSIEVTGDLSSIPLDAAVVRVQVGRPRTR
jgi:hypothetical protein